VVVKKKYILNEARDQTGQFSSEPLEAFYFRWTNGADKKENASDVLRRLFAIIKLY